MAALAPSLAVPAPAAISIDVAPWVLETILMVVVVLASIASFAAGYQAG